MFYLNTRSLKHLKGLEYINFSFRKCSSFLINENKYSFLKDLGLNEENPGVYDGKWDANGSVSISQILKVYLRVHKLCYRLLHHIVQQMVYQ